MVAGSSARAEVDIRAIAVAQPIQRGHLPPDPDLVILALRRRGRAIVTTPSDEPSTGWVTTYPARLFGIRHERHGQLDSHVVRRRFDCFGVLENAGLIHRSVDRQWRRIRISAEPLRAASDWLRAYRRYWEDSFDALVRHLERQDEEAAKHDHNMEKDEDT